MAGRVPTHIMLDLIGFLITLSVGPGHTTRFYHLSYYWFEFNITNANDYCKSLDGYLMEINSREEYELIRNLIIEKEPFVSVFLGGNDIGHQGVWTWFNSGTNATDLSWAVGEPNNWHGPENCMTVNPLQKYQLNDLDCHAPGKFLCEIPDFVPGNTTRYHLSYYWTEFNITKANDYCKSLDGYLMEINSREEYKLIRNLIIEKEPRVTVFLGGNDIGHQGVWTWYNSGKNATDLSWAAVEPNNQHGHENCMTVNPWQKYQLNDLDCHAPGIFLCEIPDIFFFLLKADGPENTTKAYHLGFSWFDFTIKISNDFCKDLNGHLMEINSREEYEMMREMIMEKKPGEPVFIGGNDIGHEGVWTWYNSGQNVTDNIMWAEGQPDNRDGHENCMIMDPLQNYQLNDLDCYRHGRFLCEIPFVGPLHTKKFYLLHYPWKWFDLMKANNICKKFIYGHLMEINSREEYEIIREMIIEKKPQEQVFLGGYDIGHEGDWKWYNSETNVMDNLMWARGQPDNWQGHENCMTVDPFQNFLLNDVKCRGPGKFLCEIPGRG